MHSWNVYHSAREFTSEPGNPGPKLTIDSNLRDLVKWGFVWLNRGVWDDEELIPGDYVELATHQVNPDVPDAYYGYDWFVNAGQSLWPDAPPDTFGAFGHGGPRAMFVIPSLDIVVSYNDAHELSKWVNGPDNPTNRAIGLLVDAVQHL